VTTRGQTPCHVEHVDAVVVGARCAGSATAIALARGGRRVVAIDRARFPSDTLSTHLLFAGGVAELDAVGALERVEALGAPRMPRALVGGAGLTVTTGYTPIGGIDYGLCVRRTGLDAALVATAREAGADVREGTRAVGVVWDGPRAAGVRVQDADGHERELRAPLVVGADGRRSAVARHAGAAEPYRSNPNGRACYFAYWQDPHAEWRGIAAQWREGEELGTAFPCDAGLVLVLLMPPVRRAPAFRADLQGEYERTIEAIPALRDRLHDCRQATKVRAATDTTSYFRRSSGPGWALPGDAGHFKDPVTAQGIRDAVRYGRLLGEAAAPVLGDPAALDAALRAWERRREDECLEAYQWTNQLARAEAITPLEAELYRRIAAHPAEARGLLDVFARSRQPSDVVGPARALGLAARALTRPGADRRAVLRIARRDLRNEVANRRERSAGARARARARAEPAA
jgi:flavin-dependent dehydrogenase